MAISPLDVLTIVVKMTQAGQAIRNVWQIIHNGSSDVTEAQAMTDIRAWIESIYAEIYGALANDLTFDTIEVSNVTDGTPVGEAAFPTLTAGTDADDALPLQVAAVVRFPTNYLGSQGRKFVAGLTKDDVDENGILIGARLSDLADFAAEALAGLTIGGESFLPGCDNPALSRFAVYQSAIVNDVVGTQRRRKQGVGI